MTAAAAPDRDTQLLLLERARLLARGAEAAAARALDVLEFTVAGQDCAIELRWLREVAPLRGIALLPHTADGLLGIAHLRGRMLPLVKLAPLLHRTDDAAPEAGTLVVVGEHTSAFCFIATDVQGLGRIAEGEVERTSAQLAPVQMEAVRGTTRTGRVLLDGEFLLHHFEDTVP